MQEYDGVYKPVTFTSRTLKPNEINYGMVDKEVLALDDRVCYTQLATRSIKVLTRHSTLAWLLHSSGLQGRLERWAALLSSWTLEIVKCTKEEDEILGVIAASITPRKEVDSILVSIAPRKQPRQVISMPPPTVKPDERLLVVSFDGSAQWTVISAASKYKLDLTVEAEYHGLLLCLDLLSDMDRGRLVICGDSNLVIRQMKGEIECKAPGLTLLRQQALERLRSWPNHEFLHMKRDWNQSADSLAKIVQRMRMERISRAHDEEKWIADLKAYMRGDVQDLTSVEAKSCAKIADRYETDESWLLFYFPPTKQSDEDRDLVAKLVSVQRYVGQCIDCETGKGRPTIHGESPGNLQATYPFQIIGMDHIPSLPRSYKGNTGLLIWIDLFTGYVIAKASASRTAQTVAENYEE
ncbi:Hypothetical protein PHPALM_10883 [Phytophthora palmivora]|uniref:Integrase catalytic domain-containing protein n=1 Tax=Phytophthora palmivora TaxID=4796 RepID=A0A2P4Y3P4_9STRA|nr:Hypothetical protein PHPALM_10883 [Phytophthora palmivora]